jgi:type IV secretory pathway TrbD component
MPATYIFPLLLVGLWIVVLILFAWMHRPEPTMAEIIRGLESRS